MAALADLVQNSRNKFFIGKGMHGTVNCLTLSLPMSELDPELTPAGAPDKQLVVPFTRASGLCMSEEIPAVQISGADCNSLLLAWLAYGETTYSFRAVQPSALLAWLRNHLLLTCNASIA
jgi:hypothetical protein